MCRTRAFGAPPHGQSRAGCTDDSGTRFIGTLWTVADDAEDAGDEREPQHALGMERKPRPEWLSQAEGQHVLGVPAEWIHPPRIEKRAFRHPVKWWKWRRRVRRVGPYAPHFDDREP